MCVHMSGTQLTWSLGPSQSAADSKKKPKAAVAPQPVFTKKENATVAQRVEILDWMTKNPQESQASTAAHWDKIYPNLQLRQPTISSWRSDEAKWRQRHEQTKGQAHKAKRIRQVEHPEVDMMLELWVAQAMSNGVAVLTGEIIRQKWTRFADMAGIPDDERLALSEGWLTSFKRRCGLKEFKRHGEAGSAKPTDVEAERKRIRNIISEGKYELKDIFNMDETGLFYAWVARLI